MYMQRLSSAYKYLYLTDFLSNPKSPILYDNVIAESYQMNNQPYQMYN